MEGEKQEEELKVQIYLPFQSQLFNYKTYEPTNVPLITQEKTPGGGNEESDCNGDGQDRDADGEEHCKDPDWCRQVTEEVDKLVNEKK